MGRRALACSCLALLFGLAGCVSGDQPIRVACASVSPTDPDVLADTLAVTVALAQRPDRTTEVLVRVDPLSDRGAVLFPGSAPASAAAVSASLTTDAVFHGCVNERADAFRLELEEAPVGRVWVRVSSNRPVAVRLVTEEAEFEATREADRPAALIVAPGASGRRAWPPDASPRNRE